MLQENQEALTTNDRPVSATEEVKIDMESPVVANCLENSSQPGALADSGNHSETDQLSSRKSMEPLPLPPEAEAPQANASRPTPPPPSPPGDDEDEEEDNPYDYARVPGRESDVEISDNDSGNEAHQDEDGAARGPPGRYAKVTRHSASKETDYEPMPDLPRPPLPSMRERRDRSATDPVDPMHVGEKKTRSMTVVAESASGMPLPAVPPAKFIEEGEEPEDDMYDCIKDDLKAAIRKSAENQSPQKVYDSVDGENDMYESVTEEMKESVQQQATPALPLSPVPKSQQKANSNSPSPTKRHSGSGFLDSPKTRKAKEAAKRMNSKDASKEGKKKKLDTAPQDGESRSRHFSFIFNRKKTPSVTGKPLSPDTKQETPQEQLPSPGHRPFSSVPLPSIPPTLGPRPAVPIPRPVSYTGHSNDADEDEDEGGMYDSVTQPMSRSVPDSDDTMPKLVSATRGAGGGGANPHLNEPLPDVPEDSGSGSAGGGASVVKHPRLVEMSDPSYDTVVTQRQEELSCDPNYDTVQLPKFSRKPQQQPLPGTTTTTPPYRPSPERDESVSHDEQGYAVVDPNVILRKRVSSLSKSAVKEANDEPGYEKVKKDDLPTGDQSEEPGYESVTKQQREEAEYDSLDQVSGTEPIQPVEPGYASVTRLPDGTAKLEQDESAKEPGYEKARTDTSSNDDQADKQQEPNYDSVTEQNEPEYDSLDQIEKSVQQPVEPGYATVTGHMAAGISTLSTTGDQDDMYSQIDLAKKHKNEETDPQEMLSSTVEEDRITSPAPPIPAQGDLGDISEFEPPPIPEPQFDLLDEEIESPYATVTKPGSDETRKTSEDSPVADESEQVNQSEAVDASTQADSTGSEPTNKERLSEPTAATAESVSERTAEAREEEVVITDTSSAEHEKVNSTPADEGHTESTPSSAKEETPVNTTQENQTEGTSISATTTDISTEKPNSASTKRSSLEESQPLYDSLESTIPSSQPNHTTSEAAKLPSENVYDSLLAVQAKDSS